VVDATSRLHHPNVLLFMGACTVPGHMAIVMELMQEGNFEKLLHDPERKLSLYQRLKMAKQTSQGMNWLHLSKPMIIHRYVGLCTAVRGSLEC
jgi:serine/threonine protein kinase